MEKRRLGRTNLELSVIGFGGIVCGRCTVEEGRERIEFSLEQGVNYLDTAPSYGECEQIIGAVLTPSMRDSLIIGGKSHFRSREETAQALEQTLRLLGRDYLDIYHIHALDTDEQFDQVFDDDGAIRAVDDARRAGKVRFVGVTGHVPRTLVRALKSYPFDSVMTPINFVHNFVHNAEGGVMKYAASHDIGVIAIKPTDHYLIPDEQLAYNYVLSLPVTTAIPGGKWEDFKRGVGIGARYKRLSSEEMDELLFNSDATRGICRQCGYCLPCPAGINVPYLLRIHGLFTRLPHTVKYAEKELAEVEPKPNACTGCRLCEERCPFNVEVRKFWGELNDKLK